MPIHSDSLPIHPDSPLIHGNLLLVHRDDSLLVPSESNKIYCDSPPIHVHSLRFTPNSRGLDHDKNTVGRRDQSQAATSILLPQDFLRIPGFSRLFLSITFTPLWAHWFLFFSQRFHTSSSSRTWSIKLLVDSHIYSLANSISSFPRSRPLLSSCSHLLSPRVYCVSDRDPAPKP